MTVCLFYELNGIQEIERHPAQPETCPSFVTGVFLSSFCLKSSYSNFSFFIFCEYFFLFLGRISLLILSALFFLASPNFVYPETYRNFSHFLTPSSSSFLSPFSFWVYPPPYVDFLPLSFCSFHVLLHLPPSVQIKRRVLAHESLYLMWKVCVYAAYLHSLLLVHH